MENEPVKATYFEVALIGYELTYGEVRQLLLLGLSELVDRAEFPSMVQNDQIKVTLLARQHSRVA